MDVTRRRLLTLLAGSLGLGSVVAGWRRAATPAVEQTAPTPTAATTTTTSRPSATPTASGPPVTLPTPEALTVIGREGWSSRAQGQFRRHRIERITIHHTAVELIDNRQAPSRLRRHQDWHMSHGWPDLAYHFMVDRDGNVYEGRPVDAIGDTFTEYDPTGHLLPCFESHFDLQEPTAEQLAAMTRLVAWAMDTFAVPTDRISGHRDWAKTTCPGDNMYWRLAGIARGAADNGPVALEYLHDRAAAARVAEIERGV